MKKIVLSTITFYKNFCSPLLHQLFGVTTVCRHSLSCSEYTQTVVRQYGVMKGSFLALKRVLNCQPYFTI